MRRRADFIDYLYSLHRPYLSNSFSVHAHALDHQWLEETATGPDLLCIVIFRGSWCKYDKHYLQKLGDFHIGTMKQENVKIIAWTSEGAAGAARADQEWGLTEKYGYDMVLGDDTNALANWLKEDEILPGLAIATPAEANVAHLLPPGGGESRYPHGLVQPGMVWYAHHGNPVFQWVQPFDAAAGLTGGPGRPDPVSLWAAVLKRKHALDHGSTVMPSHGDHMKLCSTDAEVTLANCVVL